MALATIVRTAILGALLISGCKTTISQQKNATLAGSSGLQSLRTIPSVAACPSWIDVVENNYGDWEAYGTQGLTGRPKSRNELNRARKFVTHSLGKEIILDERQNDEWKRNDKVSCQYVYTLPSGYEGIFVLRSYRYISKDRSPNDKDVSNGAPWVKSINSSGKTTWTCVGNLADCRWSESIPVV